MAKGKNSNNQGKSPNRKGASGPSGGRLTVHQARSAPLSSAPTWRMNGLSRQIAPTNRGIRVRSAEQVYYTISLNSDNSFVKVPVGGYFSAFTWLTMIAGNYSVFRVHRLRGYLFSNCPATQRGEISLAWCPDFLDATAWVVAKEPTYIYNYANVTSGPAWTGDGKQLVLDVGPSDLQRYSTNPWKRVGSTATPDGNNQIMAGCFLLQVGSNQSGSSQSVGNLFIEYDIEFAEPANSSVNVLRSHHSSDGIEVGTGPDTRIPVLSPSIQDPDHPLAIVTGKQIGRAHV